MDKLLPDIIEPEGLKVAQTYLECGGDTKQAAMALCVPIETVEGELKKKEVVAYINRQFMELGFRNKFKFFDLIDTLIEMKLAEMSETGLGTSMDIMEILKLQHKMKMDEAKMEVEKIKAEGGSGPKVQNNVQVNNMPGSEDSAYMDLLAKLGNPKK